MNYGHEVREAAFQLYCQGLGSRQIALRLSETVGGSISRNTISVWVHRYQWRERRLRLQRQVERMADEQWLREAAQLLSKLSHLRNNILDAATAQPFKSAEGAVRSLATVQKVIGSLLMTREDGLTPDQLEAVMATVFHVLQQDEVLGPVLAERQEALLAQIEARLAADDENDGSGAADVVSA